MMSAVSVMTAANGNESEQAVRVWRIRCMEDHWLRTYPHPEALSI